MFRHNLEDKVYVMKDGKISMGRIVARKKIDTSYKFKVKKERKLEIKYEINKSEYFANFYDCEFSNKLTLKLREHGFIVAVYSDNPNFLMSMIQTAILYGSSWNFAICLCFKYSFLNTEYIVLFSCCDLVRFSKYHKN